MSYEFPPQENTEARSKLEDIVARSEELSTARLSPEVLREKSKELVEELVDHLESDLGLELSADVTTYYEEMAREHLLARVEDIARVMECIEKDAPIAVGSSDKHYANSVTADQEGLRIAMAEAEALGPVRLLIGLDVKTLIGFKGDHLEVSEIDDNEMDIRDTQLRKAYCRHVNGEIHKDDIKYLVMRIPTKLFPQERLSEAERQAPSPFVFRGARLSTQKTEAEAPLAQAA